MVGSFSYSSVRYQLLQGWSKSGTLYLQNATQVYSTRVGYYCSFSRILSASGCRGMLQLLWEKVQNKPSLLEVRCNRDHAATLITDNAEMLLEPWIVQPNHQLLYTILKAKNEYVYVKVNICAYTTLPAVDIKSSTLTCASDDIKRKTWHSVR